MDLRNEKNKNKNNKQPEVAYIAQSEGNELRWREGHETRDTKRGPPSPQIIVFVRA